jgi:hypothetical protein
MTRNGIERPGGGHTQVYIPRLQPSSLTGFTKARSLFPRANQQSPGTLSTVHQNTIGQLPTDGDLSFAGRSSCVRPPYTTLARGDLLQNTQEDWLHSQPACRPCPCHRGHHGILESRPRPDIFCSCDQQPCRRYEPLKSQRIRLRVVR